MDLGGGDELGVHWFELGSYALRSARCSDSILFGVWIITCALTAMFCTLHGQDSERVIDSELQMAMTLGDLAAVQKLIASGADPNILNPVLNGRPVWLSALLMGQKRIFYAMSERMTIAPSPKQSLGQIGADAYQRSATGRGYADVVQMLLDRGMDVNARRFLGIRAILVAASNGDEQIVNLLLNRQADPNITDQHGDTALMAAVRAGSLPIVKALLARGADAKATDKHGRTAIWWVARTDRRDILKDLIQRHAEINVADKSGKHSADAGRANGPKENRKGAPCKRRRR